MSWSRPHTRGLFIQGSSRLRYRSQSKMVSYCENTHIHGHAISHPQSCMKTPIVIKSHVQSIIVSIQKYTDSHKTSSTPHTHVLTHPQTLQSFPSIQTYSLPQNVYKQIHTYCTSKQPVVSTNEWIFGDVHFCGMCISLAIGKVMLIHVFYNGSF